MSRARRFNANRPAFQVPDAVPWRWNVPTVREWIRAYYAKPEHEAGGNCHVVLDDGNIRDKDIMWTLDRCVTAGDADGAFLMLALHMMTGTQRRKLCR